MNISPHCTHRLESFITLAVDIEYGTERAINGLRAWQRSQAYRLTSDDNALIESKICWAQSLKPAKPAKIRK
jgi:hypothetical protein